jgi:hypothetical protein
LARIYDPLGLASPPHWPENLFIGVRVTVKFHGTQTYHSHYERNGRNGTKRSSSIQSFGP